MSRKQQEGIGVYGNISSLEGESTCRRLNLLAVAMLIVAVSSQFFIPNVFGMEIEPPVKVNSTSSTFYGGAVSVVAFEGNVYAVWTDDRHGDRDIYFSRSTDDGNSFSQDLRINDDIGSTEQTWGMLALGPSGRIYVVWDDDREGTLSDWDIYLATSDDGGQSFGPNVRVNPDTSSGIQENAAIAVSADEIVYVAYADELDSLSLDPMQVVLTKSTDHGAHFSTPVNVSQAGQHTYWYGTTAIATFGANDVYMAWSTGNGEVFFSRSSDGGESFQTHFLEDGTMPSLSVDDQGRIYVAFMGGSRTSPQLLVKESGNGGVSFSWSDKVNDSPVAWVAVPSITTDEAGRVLVAWMENRTGSRIPEIYFSFAPGFEQPFGENIRIDQNSFVSDMYPCVAADTQGNAYVLWGTNDTYLTVLSFDEKSTQESSWFWVFAIAVVVIIVIVSVLLFAVLGRRKVTPPVRTQPPVQQPRYFEQVHPTTENDFQGRIKKLKELKDQGLITEEEFQLQKKRILDEL